MKAYYFWIFVVLHFIFMFDGYKDGSLLMWGTNAIMHYWWLYNEKRNWAFIFSCIAIGLSVVSKM